MKLKIDGSPYTGYRVWRWTLLWGWEPYDTLTFGSYSEALAHANNIKRLG